MIITSLLDTDLYKFTTSYAYTKLFPYAVGKFSFIDRDGTKYTEAFVNKLRSELEEMSTIKLTNDELEYMTAHCRFLPRLYWEWLSSFHFDPQKVNIWLDQAQHLHIEVTDAMYKCTLYEVPLLAVVSEIRNEMLGNKPDSRLVLDHLAKKVKLSNDHQLSFSEFGTRRRFSLEVEEEVIKYLKENSRYCTGTSNCLLAKKYDMTMMGTHPHEWFMFHGAQFGYKHANYLALENWVNVYDGDLGIALADTYTFDIFLSNFSRKQAKLFDGVRCDSGNEHEFVDMLISRYKELAIDPTTKVIVFSNALDFNKVLDIKNYCEGKIRCSFGIGTNLSNDAGFQPANIVMKLTSCKMNSTKPWVDCVKLSDDEGKHTGKEEEVLACMDQLGIE
jgi:nicotinate phosphoribosyltransferase